MQADNNTTYYRPRNNGHDYHDRGIYLITLVVREREKLLGRLNTDPYHPMVEMSEIGCAVADEWEKTTAIQAQRGNHVRLLAQVVMPDHWHGVLAVDERLDKSVGAIIQATKSACTVAYRKMCGIAVQPSSAEQIRHMSFAQRQEYYATIPKEERPLFDDNYDDTICLDERHRSAMLHYVADNPRRAIIRRLRHDYMRRCLHVVRDGRDYAAFGNLFLLRWPRKVQVFCHRKARINGQVTDTPYIETADYQNDRQRWIDQVMEGATVLVTPGISPGELAIKNECLSKGYPLIHIQKEPIGAYWKPERSRFEAAERGALLILAPWNISQMGDTHVTLRNGTDITIAADSDYSQFHNMNTLAAEICAFDGEAKVVGRG